MSCESRENGIPEERRIVAVDSAWDASSKQLRERVLLDVSAKVQQLIGDRTELHTDAGLRLAFCAFVILLDQMRMFHQCEAMANTFGSQQSGVIQVGVSWVAGAPSVEECLSCVEQERNFERLAIDESGFACLLESKKLRSVEPNVVWPVLCTNQVKS